MMPRLPSGKIALLVAGCLAVAAAAAALYGTAGVPGNRVAGAACAASAAKVAALKPLATGAVAAFAVQETPRALPALAFTGADGRPASLADFRGRTVLLNLWATWCAPCREEMPALDRLQADLGGDGFQVVAVNIDTRNVERPRAWLQEAGIANLAYYADPQAKVFQELKGVGKAFGMPTTLLVGPDGCELGMLSGPADWASPEAKALVGAAFRPGP